MIRYISDIYIYIYIYHTYIYLYIYLVYIGYDKRVRVGSLECVIVWVYAWVNPRACASAITRKTEYNGRIINANEVEGSGKFRFDEDTRCEGEKWNARGGKEREERGERRGRKKRIKKIFTGPGTGS